MTLFLISMFLGFIFGPVVLYWLDSAAEAVKPAAKATGRLAWKIVESEMPKTHEQENR